MKGGNAHSTGLYVVKRNDIVSHLFTRTLRVNYRTSSPRWRSGRLNINASWAGHIVYITNRNLPTRSSNQLKLRHSSNVFGVDCNSLLTATLSDVPPNRLLHVKHRLLNKRVERMRMTASHQDKKQSNIKYNVFS